MMRNPADQDLRSRLVSKMHELDWAEENAQTRDVRALEARRRMHREVAAALELLDQGRYGVCEDCGEAIKIERLVVVPWATRCVDCQNEHELRTSPFLCDEGDRVLHDSRSV